MGSAARRHAWLPAGYPVPAAQDSTEARKLAEIRAILAGFDWEWHDRQLALEAIERIVLGDEAGQ